MPTVTGPELRRERREAEVPVTVIARRMQLSRQTIHTLERDAEPSPERVTAYRQALAAEVAVKVAARQDDAA
ncbi:MAG: helix-turn-helix domain-containing protein [Baekduiaceae bacterium]